MGYFYNKVMEFREKGTPILPKNPEKPVEKPKIAPKKVEKKVAKPKTAPEKVENPTEKPVEIKDGADDDKGTTEKS